MEELHKRFETWKTATLVVARRYGGRAWEEGWGEDLKQEALLRCWQSFLRVQGRAGVLDALRWIIARRSVLQALRRHRTHRKGKLFDSHSPLGLRAHGDSAAPELCDHLPPDSGRPDEVVGARLDALRWQAGLTHRQAEVVRLRSAGHTRAEIGRMLDISRAVVCEHLAKARAAWDRMQAAD